MRNRVEGFLRVKPVLQEIQSGLSSLYVYTSPKSYEPLARIDGGYGKESIQHFHTNLAGQPEQLTDESGGTIWRSDYCGWGEIKEQWQDQRESREQNLRNQGQYHDREIGLHYNTYRFYDPSIGHFTQPDPIGLSGGINFYQYAPNSISFVDPLGLAYDPISALLELGFTGVEQTQSGGLDYRNSNALYTKKNINPVVTIEYTGDYALDAQAANTKAGLNQKSTPRGYVWHHVDDYNAQTNRGTMQLVKQTAHLGITHNGGVSQYAAVTGKRYTHPARFSKGAKPCP